MTRLICSFPTTFFYEIACGNNARNTLSYHPQRKRRLGLCWSGRVGFNADDDAPLDQLQHMLRLAPEPSTKGSLLSRLRRGRTRTFRLLSSSILPWSIAYCPPQVAARCPSAQDVTQNNDPRVQALSKFTSDAQRVIFRIGLGSSPSQIYRHARVVGGPRLGGCKRGPSSGCRGRRSIRLARNFHAHLLAKAL